MSTNNPFPKFSSHPVFKAISIYLVTAWLILQVAATTFPVFEISNTWLKGLIGLLFFGLLVTIGLSWSRSRKKTEASSRKKFSLVLIGSMVLLFGIGLSLFISRVYGNGKLPAAIQDERVAVPFFNNETGDSFLDGLGSYLSLVLTEGFKEIEVKTVNTNTIRQCMQFVNYYPGNIENKISFSEATGAQLTVNGNIYIEEDSILIVKSILTDAVTGEELKYFPEIRGSVNDRKAFSNKLKQKVLGYWVNQEEVEKGKFKAPNYDAYLTNNAGDEVFWIYDQSIPLYEKALDLDSNYHLNYIDLAIAYNNTGQVEKRKRILDRLSAKREVLTKYEKIVLDRELAWSIKDRRRYLDRCLEAFELDPKSPGDNFFAGYASNISALPYQTIQIYEQLDDRTIVYQNNLSNQTRLRDFSGAYLATHQAQKALALLETYMPAETQYNALWNNRIRAIVVLNHREKLEDLINSKSDFSFSSGISAQTSLLYSAATGYYAKGEEELTREYAERALESLKSKRETDNYIKLRLYYILEMWEEAYAISAKMREDNPADIYALSASAIAMTAQVEANNSDKINEIVQILQNMDISEQPVALIVNPNAFVDIALASIYGHLGKTEDAITLLQNAIEKNANPLEFQWDLRLKPLYNHPKFIEWSTAKK